MKKKRSKLMMEGKVNKCREGIRKMKQYRRLESNFACPLDI